MPEFGKFLKSLSTLHWFVVLLSLLLTLTAWQVSSQIAEEKAREQFDHQVEQLNELLQDRMRNYEFALIAGVGSIHGSGEAVNLSMWRRFSESLAMDERLPGINGIGVIERVAPDDLTEYVADKQEERSYFRIHPGHDRQDFWPIIYIEPEAANRAAVGLDMAHEDNRYQAALKAMETGTTQITGPIVLVQDAEKTPGFLFYRPFYDTAETPPEDQRESRFSGLVYAPFIMSSLMEGALANVNRRVQFRVTDGGSVLYSELDEGSEGNYDSTPMFSASYDMGMYGRQWHFDVQTTQLFETFNASIQPVLILIGGIVINTLIILVFILMANARQRAERKVEEKTAELRENLDFINTLTDNLPLAVSVWNADLICRFMNRYGENWFPFSKEDAIGKPLQDFLGTDLVRQRSGYYQRVLDGEPLQVTDVFKDCNGEQRDVVISYYPVALEGRRCFMATTLDVTEVVRREKELQILNEELEKQKHEAESAVTVKTAFLANMSHEIRTPMNAIIGVLVLLQEAGLEDHPRRLVQKAFSASEALLQLLNDILDLSKIEADRIELDYHPFDIDSLIHRSVDLFAIVAEEKGLRLKVTIDPGTPSRVVGDLLRISQICTNLIGNAIKFTRQGEVEVAISYVREGDRKGSLEIEVTDTGVGIRPEDQERIFENFRQADESTSRNFGGTGLGLAISRRLAHLMAGELSLKSCVGEGATFGLRVPVQEAEDAAPMSAYSSGRQIRLYHHGFATNLALLNDYQEHWQLKLEPVADLFEWRSVLEKVAWAGEPESVFFVIDLEAAQAGPLEEFLSETIATPDRYPLWSVLVVVPAGYSKDWIVPFQRSGGRISYEPLTPSRLFEHLSQRERKTPDPDATQRPKFRGISVLVVDDVPLNCEIVESYLRSFGVSSASVNNGDQALALLEKQCFDLVLMDLHLEGESGQDVTRRIRREISEKPPIIVALSASISDHDRVTAREAGMEDYMTKPVVPKDIRLLLETYFNDHRETALKPDSVKKAVGKGDHLPDCLSPDAYDQLFGSEPDLFKRCMRSFLASAPDLLEGIRVCSDANAIRELAHKIRGAAGNIADPELAQLAGQIEQTADDEKVAYLKENLEAMLAEHVRQLDATYGVDEIQTGGAIDEMMLEKALQQVTGKLKGNRIADDEDLKVILNHLLEEGQHGMAVKLRKTLEVYDFRQALVLLDEIQAKR